MEGFISEIRLLYMDLDYDVIDGGHGTLQSSISRNISVSCFTQALLEFNKNLSFI